MLQTSKALGIFPELMTRSSHTAEVEAKKVGIMTSPCLSHTEKGEVIIIRPDKTNALYEAIRLRRVTSLCPYCGWEICKKSI